VLTLPPGRWRDTLAGFELSDAPTADQLTDVAEVRLADLMADLPVALLVKEDD
jgi:maltooligosyltrehalose synthase